MSKDTILILDKDSYTQWTLKTLLESEKYITLAVNSVERALQNFKEFEVSGVITEYRIDHTNMPKVIQELKKRFPELYVMMTTDENLEEKEYKKIISLGIDDFFLKPVSSEKILIHLKKGLKQRKIFLQKKELEKKLNLLRKNKIVPEMVLSKDLNIS